LNNTQNTGGVFIPPDGPLEQDNYMKSFGTLLPVLVATLLMAPVTTWRAQGVVTPAFDRMFGTNAAGDSIRSQMIVEASNPLIAGTVVNLINHAPLDVNGDGVTDFSSWSGTLISDEWVLTCAHALEGTDGHGAGINVGDLECRTDDGQVLGIADFEINPSWQKEQYLLGNDIALVRLAVAVTGVAQFARLSTTRFTTSVGVIVAGYGEQGNGDTGGNGIFESLTAGLNTLDMVGGAQSQSGNGTFTNPFPTTPATVAFMDFDKGELAMFPCVDPINGEFINEQAVALSSFSLMGENELTRAVQACPSPIQAEPGYFAPTVCDFLAADGDSGGPAFLWPGSPNNPANGFFLTGVPVVYGVTSFRNVGTGINLDAVYGNIAGYTLVQSHLQWIYQIAREVATQDSDLDGRTDEVEFLAGTDPYRAPLAAATYLPKPLDVMLQNIRILEERLVGGSETELEFTGDLLNTDSGRYFDLSLNVDRAVLPATASVVDAQLNYATLAEMGTALAGAADTLVIRVANADLDAVRQMILTGQILQVTAFEEQVYLGPTKFIDQPTDDAFEGTSFNLLGELVLIFGTETDLIAALGHGDILIADTATGGYRPKQPPPTEQFAVPYLSQQIPFEVASVSIVGDKVHVAGHKRDLNQILKSGTFLASDENFNGGGRDLLDPPVENTYTEEEKEDRATQAYAIAEQDPKDSGLADLAGLNAIPWHFNEVEITEHLRLSGQVLLRSSGLRIQVSFREFALKRASIGIDAGIVASLLLETTGTNNNTSVALLDKQMELADIPLPGIPFTVAGVPCAVSPKFVLSVGAEANAPGGLSIPLETSITVGSEIGWADGQTFSNPIKEFAAPHVSDPTVFDAVALSAKAWVEARLEIDLSVAGGLARSGPSLAIRAEAAFAVAPLNDPWWTLDAGADLVGRFDLDLLGFNVAGVETTEHIATFFHRDAQGPLIQAPLFTPAGAGSGTPVDIGAKSGKNVRWGLAFAPANTTWSYSKGFVTPLSGGGYFVGGSSAIPGFLGVVSADGVAQWMQTFPTGAKPVDGVQLADGSVMVAGYSGLNWWLAKYDSAGNRIWVKSHVMSADLRGFAVGTAANGTPEFYLAGYQSLVIVTQSDPVVLKLDQDGNLVWAKVYTLNGDDEVNCIKVLADGNLLLAGRTGSKVGTHFLIGASRNGLVMKIAPSGDRLWSTAVPGRWGMDFYDVAEGPDGSIYAVGQHNDIVVNYYPSILVAKFSPEGELIHHVLIGEDPDWIDELPDGGDTPYDSAAHVAWAADRLIVVGTTGLGGTTTAWAASMTDELGVNWFSVFDGPGASAFDDVAFTEDGIVAMGWMDDPWPTKFTNRTPACLVSLPWEGMMRFHPETGAQSRYLQPHVYLSSSQTDFIGTTTDDLGRVTPVYTAPVPFVISNTVPVAGANVSAGVFTTVVTARLERIEPSILDSYDEWTAYHQLSGTNALPTDDIDQDGAANLWEYFSGTDPLQSNTNSPVGLAIQYDVATGTVVIDFPRSRAAANQVFNLQYSLDLNSWLPAANTALQVVGSDELLDWLKLTLPVPDPNHAFFRLELPTSP
jgi:hypothetical protein